MIKIKNISNEIITLCGKELLVNEIYRIEYNERLAWANNTDVIEKIENQDLEIHNIDGLIEGVQSQIAFLKQTYHSSYAVDLENTDCNISGNDWHIIEATRTLWDINEDYSLEDNYFTVPFDGIYFLDAQIKIKSISNVSAIELAIMKYIDESTEDYWFILDKKIITTETECQLSAGTMFDLYENEKYIVKIKLYGNNASAVIDGSDDFTALGMSFENKLKGY